MIDDSNINGAFVESLKRKNSKIREDRASAIAEDAELLYKRAVEDIETVIKRLKREQENMMDLSPDNTLSLKPANDFNADEYVNRDIEIGVEIRKMEIKLKVAQDRYTYLFGGV